MKLISHRGNISGINPLKENSIDYVEEAISEGFDVEIDLWVVDGSFYLGHDDPKYYVPMSWLVKYKDVLWIHSKNMQALEEISTSSIDFNYFWHEQDRYTVTSKGIIWVLIGQFPCSNSVIVLPEAVSMYVEPTIYFDKCYGICSDVIQNYQYLNKI